MSALEHSPSSRLADRMAAARRRLFIGRVSEVELFRQALLADELPFAILHIFGPGGVGKTTLLREYALLAAEVGRAVVWLDGRDIDASPQGVLFALSQALRSSETALTQEALAELPPAVLLFDTYERMAHLDGWLRETFLPLLPTHTLVVVAGRNLPPSAWRTDPAWRNLARIISLRNLWPEESQALLAALKVPKTLQDSVTSLTYGHPLALALMADWLALGPPAGPLALERAPDVVRLLVERFVQDVPSSRHRRALEISAHVRVITESLLAEVLGVEEAQGLFDWLRGLSFMEQGPEGLFPHDLVRDVLESDIRWRNPDAYRHMHRQVRRYLVRRYEESKGVQQQRAFMDLLYLHRHQPLMKPYYEWKAFGSAYVEPLDPQDRLAILQMVERHEGEESARIAAYWLQRQPQAFEVFRASAPAPLGFVVNLILEAVTPEDEQIDPAMRAIWAYIHRCGPLRPGERFLCTRFWMGRETYQDALIHNLVAMTTARLWLMTPNLRWSFPCGADADHWAPMFAYLNFRRAAEADFEVAGRRYGVFAHDWRIEPPVAWMELMGERELQEELGLAQLNAVAAPDVMVLSQPEFAEAVRQALRDYTRPDALAGNPLLRSRLLIDQAGPSPGPTDLQALLRQAVERLKAIPKDEKLYRALHWTYLHPAPTQEAVAELLDLPFSTYRYHLSKGIERITGWLWQQELYGSAGTASETQVSF